MSESRSHPVLFRALAVVLGLLVPVILEGLLWTVLALDPEVEWPKRLLVLSEQLPDR
jgi:hypothetical protein